MGVSTLRDYLRAGGLPHFKLKGKILVKRSEFDEWLENFRVSGESLNHMVGEIMNNLKTAKSE